MHSGDQKRRGSDEDGDVGGKDSALNPSGAGEREEGPKAWAILFFGLIGASVTTYAAGQLRKSIGFFWAQLYKAQSFTSWKRFSSYRGLKEEAWKRYSHRLQEQYEEEMERMERIKKMQSVFNSARNKHMKGYQSWRKNGPSGDHQHFQHDDWYWTGTSYQEQRGQRAGLDHSYSGNEMSDHYLALGLDRSREKPYTEEDIKTAFRAKALEYHPDQNQNNKEAAEAKFKEVMAAYEAIKSERKKAGSS